MALGMRKAEPAPTAVGKGAAATAPHCLETCTWSLVGECGSLLPLVNPCLPMGKTAWISRVGKKTAKTAYGGLIFLALFRN